MALNRPPATYSADRLAALNRDLEERLTRLPGVRGAGLALYNPLTDNWGELVLVAGHPPPKPGEQAGASWDRVSANYLQNLGVKLVRGRHFNASDNESSETVAVVNEAFVRRFFKSDEDPLDKRFGLDMPENVNTYRIVGIVRDAKFAGFQLNRPARPMFYVALAQTVDYTNPLMKRLEFQSHFVRGLLLVTDLPPAALEPQVEAGIGGGGSEPDRHQRADAAAADRSLVRSAARRRQPRRAVRHCRAGARGDRALWRHRLLGGAADQRDRHPHGARGRSRERAGYGPAGRLPAGRRLELRLACHWRSAPDIFCRRSSTVCGSGIRWRSASAPCPWRRAHFWRP